MGYLDLLILRFGGGGRISNLPQPCVVAVPYWFYILICILSLKPKTNTFRIYLFNQVPTADVWVSEMEIEAPRVIEFSAHHTLKNFHGVVSFDQSQCKLQVQAGVRSVACTFSSIR